MSTKTLEHSNSYELILELLKRHQGFIFGLVIGLSCGIAWFIRFN